MRRLTACGSRARVAGAMRLVAFVLAGLAAIAGVRLAAAQQQPSSEPILRVETGMHTAPILAAATDVAGHILATASHDRTVRLWSLADGAPIRVLRPPIGNGDEGWLNAVAVSPDGKSAVAAGYTGYQWEKLVCLYLFDATSGELLRRIPGLPNAVSQLAWSPDGRLIAAALMRGGIRIFRTSDGEEVGRDTEYSAGSYGIAFDPSGRIAATENGPAAPQAEQEGTIAVPIEHHATITLVARAGERQSEAANLRLAWKPPTPAPARKAAPKPKLYVLAVGVSRYKDAELQLHYAAKDAGDVAAAWAAQQGGLYREVETRILRDEEATREAVLDGLDWIEPQTTARDVALVLLAGHGENDGDGAYYYLPYDVDADRLRRTAVLDIEIRRSLSRVAGKALFFFDTCHSGSVMGGRRGKPIDINGIVSELASAEHGLVVYSSSTGREFAIESEEWHNGAFSKALVEGLAGQADISGDGVITISELEFWLAERVKTLTGGHQHPTTVKPLAIQDFPIAAVR